MTSNPSSSFTSYVALGLSFPLLLGISFVIGTLSLLAVSHREQREALMSSGNLRGWSSVDCQHASAHLSPSSPHSQFCHL